MCMGWGLFRKGDEFKGPPWAGCQNVGPRDGVWVGEEDSGGLGARLKPGVGRR